MGILRLLRTIRILRAIRAVRLKAKIVEAVSIRSAVYAPPQVTHPPPASLRPCCFPPLTDQPCRVDSSQSRTGSRRSSAAQSSFLY